MVSYDEYQSGAGVRLEYYHQALEIGLENPILGVGVGGVVSELETRFADGRLRHYTDNVHGEFMNMLAAGGFPGLILFVAFVGSIGLYGLRSRREQMTWLGDAFVGLAVIVGISALFNSTVKDYGEKHALLVLLPLLFSYAQGFEGCKRS
jgi:O-antigen ligase